MKISDIILIILVILIATTMIIFNKKEDSDQALVYYENDLVLKIDLNQNKEYDVEGYNGNVHIVVMNKKIKVEEENSPKHICSKQGFISSSNETIVCLPNKIVIKIESKDKLDTVIG